MAEGQVDLDDLIERLRQRARDPDRRVDITVDRFSEHVRTLSLGQLLDRGQSVATSLKRVVDANRQGLPLDQDLVAEADRFAVDISTPAHPDLPSVATEADLQAAEAALETRLPHALRRIYAEVADGGFGPGSGLLSLRAAVAAYLGLRAEPAGPTGQAWPEGLLPLREYEPGYDGVDVTSGRMIAWDPEELTERSGDRAWQRSFSELAPSVEAWLDDWVGAKSPNELIAENAATMMVEQARKSRAMIAAMTPEARAAMGLPEVGWEQVVWGGIGLDPDDG
jgi:hypothetical protein